MFDNVIKLYQLSLTELSGYISLFIPTGSITTGITNVYINSGAVLTGQTGNFVTTNYLNSALAAYTLQDSFLYYPLSNPNGFINSIPINVFPNSAGLGQFIITANDGNLYNQTFISYVSGGDLFIPNPYLKIGQQDTDPSLHGVTPLVNVIIDSQLGIGNFNPIFSIDITGSIGNSLGTYGNHSSIDVGNSFLLGQNNVSLDWTNCLIYDQNTTESLDWTNRFLFDINQNISSDWNQRILYGNYTFGNNQIWTIDNFIVSGNINISGNGFISGNSITTGGPYYPLNSNPNNYLTGFNSGLYILNSQTGKLTGVFYPLNSNPNNYLTGFNSGLFYPSSNPSGFITGFNSGLYTLNSITGRFVTTGQTGSFITTGANGVLNLQGLGVYSINIGPTDTTRISVINRQLLDASPITSIDWGARVLIDQNALNSINWNNRKLLDFSQNVSIDWQNYILNGHWTFQSGNFISGLSASGYRVLTTQDISGISFSGGSNQSFTGFFNITGINGITVSGSGQSIIIGQTGFTSSSGNYTYNQSGSYLFNTSATSGLSTQFISFPNSLGTNPFVICTLNNSGNENILIQTSGITSSGYWANYSNPIDNSGYVITTLASISSNTGLATTIIIQGGSGTFYPLVGNPSGFITTGQTGAFGGGSTPTGNLTGVFYPLYSNPSGYATTGQLNNYVNLTGPQNINGVKTFNDIPNFIYGFWNPGGGVLGLAGDSLFYNTLYIGNGENETSPSSFPIWFKSNGNSYYQGSGFFSGLLVSGNSVITTNQTGNFITNNQTGNFVTSFQTGIFYLNTNPSGFITGFNSGLYTLNSNTGNFITTSQTGVFGGGGNTGILTGIFYPLNSNPSGYITSGQTGAFGGSANTGNLTGAFYPLKSNPTGYAFNNQVIHNTGSEIISGIKSFQNNIILSGQIYNDATITPSNSNFIGIGTFNAGAYATLAHDSNFIGQGAGWSGVFSANSNFIGTYAGFSSYNSQYANLIGAGAGQATTNVSFSNFFGNQAGNSAANASNTILIGNYCGYNATNASNSIFLGYQAGYSATNASNSIFIGNNAGYNDTINNSSNSILIGNSTNTSGFINSICIGQFTANSAANQINIGNIIYGKNIYTGSKTSSNPVTSGQIGILTNSPNYTLDVNGSGNFSSGLFISGSGISNYFYPLNSNPSGFITGFNSGSYYLASNPNGYITGIPLSPSIFYTTTINWLSGNIFNTNLTGNTTYTFSNNKDGQSINIVVENTGLSGYSVTWPVGIRWPNNTIPNQTSGAHIDIYSFICVTGRIYGSVVQNF